MSLHSPPDDPRIIALVAGNFATADPELTRRAAADLEDGDDIPRSWRAKGYEPVTSLISAWMGRKLDSGVLRHSWRDDLTHGKSRLLPAPDAIIKRGPRGDLLPGWADKTIREWLSAREVPCNMATYLPWADVNDEIDPRLCALIAGNEARGAAFNDLEPVGLFPPAYLALGYEGTAKLITKAQGSSVANTTIRHYWGTDLKRTYETGQADPFSRRMPIPDAIITRGVVDRPGELLPGWTPRTVLDWLPTREGPGNHTSGADRRGYNRGRTGMTKVDGKWMRVAAVTV